MVLYSSCVTATAPMLSKLNSQLGTQHSHRLPIFSHLLLLTKVPGFRSNDVLGLWNFCEMHLASCCAIFRSQAESDDSAIIWTRKRESRRTYELTRCLIVTHRTGCVSKSHQSRLQFFVFSPRIVTFTFGRSKVWPADSVESRLDSIFRIVCPFEYLVPVRR